MEKELLAMIFAIENFRSYLVGTKVIIYTYHAALKYAMPDPMDTLTPRI
jgi:hypothetical protein